MYAEINVNDVITRMTEVMNVKTEAQIARTLLINQQTIYGWKKRNLIPWGNVLPKLKGLDVYYIIYGEKFEENSDSGKCHDNSENTSVNEQNKSIYAEERIKYLQNTIDAQNETINSQRELK